jgi:hypothetical protein
MLGILQPWRRIMVCKTVKATHLTASSDYIMVMDFAATLSVKLDAADTHARLRAVPLIRQPPQVQILGFRFVAAAKAYANNHMVIVIADASYLTIESAVIPVEVVTFHNHRSRAATPRAIHMRMVHTIFIVAVFVTGSPSGIFRVKLFELVIKNQGHNPETTPASFVATREIIFIFIGIMTACAAAKAAIACFVNNLPHTMPAAVVFLAVRNEATGRARARFFDYFVVIINGEYALLPSASVAIAIPDKLMLPCMTANRTDAMHI